jgi:hypothetical protein
MINVIIVGFIVVFHKYLKKPSRYLTTKICFEVKSGKWSRFIIFIDFIFAIHFLYQNYIRGWKERINEKFSISYWKISVLL